MGGSVSINGNNTEAVEGKKDNGKAFNKASIRVIALVALALIAAVMLGPAILNRPKPAREPFTATAKATKNASTHEPSASEAPSRTPIIDAMRQPEKAVEQNPVNAEQIAHTATVTPPQPAPKNLGAIPNDGWSPKPYAQSEESSTDSATNDAPQADTRSEHDAMDKASLVFVKSTQPAPGPQAAMPAVELGVGLPPGTRLRARLESAVNTAVATPVVAVIEYNYERNGAILVPAGAKVFGRLEAADRSGYVGVRFDSLMMPDGSSMPVEAAATDLQLRPLRGRVEGKNTGKNIVVRSLTGVGEIGAALVGRGSLNQPFSEGDLLRERIGNNIGQASDQQLQSLALTQRIVVSVPAGREIYVVLEKPSRETVQGTSLRAAPSTSQSSAEELGQLLRLDRELNERAPSASPR
jgi:type IV secretory pathway VirB10-like protein